MTFKADAQLYGQTGLQAEFEFYLEHQDEMVEKYDGKYIVIKEKQVLGAYDDELSAITRAKKAHELGTFLVQKVSKGTAAYSQTFHSRVGFSGTVDRSPIQLMETWNQSP